MLVAAGKQDTETVTQNNLGQEFREEMEALIASLQESLAEVIRGTDDRVALPPGAEAALAGFYEPLPETGNGPSLRHSSEKMRNNSMSEANPISTPPNFPSPAIVN